MTDIYVIYFGKPNIISPIQSNLYRSKIEEKIHMVSLNNIQKGGTPLTYENLYNATIILLMEYGKNNEYEKREVINIYIQEEKDKISRNFKRNLDYDKFNTNLTNLENMLNDETNFVDSPIFLHKLEHFVINKIKTKMNQNNIKYKNFSYEDLYNAAYDLLLNIRT
jgi:hypothetical protein